MTPFPADAAGYGAEAVCPGVVGHPFAGATLEFTLEVLSVN